MQLKRDMIYTHWCSESDPKSIYKFFYMLYKMQSQEWRTDRERAKQHHRTRIYTIQLKKDIIQRQKSAKCMVVVGWEGWAVVVVDEWRKLAVMWRRRRTMFVDDDEELQGRRNNTENRTQIIANDDMTLQLCYCL